jgi:hypothetical protein
VDGRFYKLAAGAAGGGKLAPQAKFFGVYHKGFSDYNHRIFLFKPTMTAYSSQLSATATAASAPPLLLPLPLPLPPVA